MKQIEVLEVFLAQKGKCFYCFKPMSLDKGNKYPAFTRDHFHPKYKKKSLKGNMVLAHKICNSLKGKRNPTKEEERRFALLTKKVTDRRAELLNMQNKGKLTRKSKVKYVDSGEDFGKW